MGYTSSVLPDDEVAIQVIPVKIEREHLIPDGSGKYFLITAQERERIKKALADKPPGVRYKAKDLQSEYDIIKAQDGKLFILYHPNALGSGAFGTAKICQDLDTGEFEVAKLLSQGADLRQDDILGGALPRRRSEEKVVEEAQYEVDPLRQLGELRGVASHQTKRKGFQMIVVMKLAQGMDLVRVKNSFIARNRNKPTVEWMKLAEDMFGEVKKLHDMGIVHRDLKGANMVYNTTDGTLAIIDKGLSRKMDANGKYASKRAGTPRTMAPECYKGQFSSASDVFACGATLGDLFGLGKYNRKAKPPTFEILTDAEIEKLSDSLIRDPQARIVVADFLRRCLDHDPMKRPTTQEAKKFFNEIKENFLYVPTKTFAVGILNVQEYMVADDATRVNMIAALQQFDKVILVDTKQNRNPQDYALIKKHLDDNNVLVEGRVIKGATLNKAIEKIPAKLNTNPNIFHECFHVSTNPANTYENNVNRIVVTHDDGEKYRAQIFNRPIDSRVIDRIANGLSNEINRLEAKYGKKGKVSDPIVKQRIYDINKLQERLQEGAASRTVNYQQARMLLLDAQSKMLSTSKLGKQFGNFGMFKTQGAKKMQELTTTLDAIQGDQRPRSTGKSR